MRRAPLLILTILSMLGLLAAPAAAARGGTPGSPIVADAIYADGELHGTILQKALRYNGNDASYDRLFLVPDQPPVSEAAPGNRDYNGGRWLPTPVAWVSTPYLLTSYADVAAAAAAGHLVVHDPVTEEAFLCPLIRQ